MLKWFAFLMHGTDPRGNAFVGVFVGPTQVDDPVMPPRGKRLGDVHANRARAVDEAIRYLTAERAVSEADALRRTL